MADFVIENGVLKKYTGNDSCITIPEEVTEIGRVAFSSCYSVTSVSIPSSVRKIGDEAFRGCSGLKTVSIPDSVVEIGDKAFDLCWNLEPDEDGFCIIRDTMYFYVGSNPIVNIPDGVRIIGDVAFKQRDIITSVTMSDSVEVIGACAFLKCKNLSEVRLSANVEKLQSSLFSDCKSLASIRLPQKIQEIGYRAFYNCTNLRDIIVDGTVTEVGENAFDNCYKLRSLLVEPALIKETEPRLVAYATWLNTPERLNAAAHKDKTIADALAKKKRILQIALDNDMAHIMRIFADNGKITKKNIDSDYLSPAMEADANQCVAFLLDWKSGKVTAKDEEKKIEREFEKDPFNITDMKKLWSFNKREDGLLEITSYKGTSKSITVPGRIGQDTVTMIGAGALSPNKKGRPAVQGAPLKELVSIEIPESVKIIDAEAFYGCTCLRSINIPDSIEFIGSSAFSGCSGLADENGFIIFKGVLYGYCGNEHDVSVPEGVTEISRYAFQNCADIQNIDLPQSTSKIYDESFSNCENLLTIKINNPDTFIYGEAIYKCPHLKAVYVPAGSFAEKIAKDRMRKVKPIK